MESQFWHERWQRNEIGFHQSEANQHLVRQWSRLRIAAERRVLVPLCGKSLDLLWLLDQGHPVVGVELSPIAVEAFFEANGIDYTRREEGGLGAYRHGELTLYCGDFFDLRPQHLQGVDVVYDRAALVALPEAMRRRYAQHLAALLPGRLDMLLVTMEYDQAEMSGPPFAVPEAEVRTLYGSHYGVDLLERFDLLEQAPRFRERGLSHMAECVYHIATAA